MLRVNLQNSENIIRNIIKSNQKKQFFIVINVYLNKLALFPNEKIRDVLYNIEQFKFDAMIQPELKMRGPPSSGSTNSSSSSNSTKSRGSSNGKDKACNNTKTGGSMANRMIKDSDKSSGTKNLVGNGGGSTLTGKNPFAVLKASSIAAS
jgi:hypothetical protein